MKKIFSFVVFAMLTISMNAQDITGSWIAEEDFNEKVKMSMDQQNENVDVKFGMVIDKSTILAVLNLNVEADGMKMKLKVEVPGVYERDGQLVTTEFNSAGTNISIVDVESNDPEMKEMLGNPETKKMLFAMMEGMIKEQMGEYKNSFEDMTEVFKQFTIKSVTASKLTIEVEEMELGFNKM